jgi:hypothetical protein
MNKGYPHGKHYRVLQDFNTNDFYIVDHGNIIRIGPYPTREAAQKALDEIRSTTNTAQEQRP